MGVGSLLACRVGLYMYGKTRKETPEETEARLAMLYTTLVDSGMEPERAERVASNAKPVFDRETGTEVWPQRQARKSVRRN